LSQLDLEVQTEIDEALEFAEGSPLPKPETALTEVYAPEYLIDEEPGLSALATTTRQISMGVALNEALREEMTRNSDVFLLGEDLGKDSVGPGIPPLGGLWPPTAGLCREFPDRVINTPISESEIAGAATGAAMVGMRPVAEIMFADFLSIAMDQIANTAAKMRYNYGGKCTVPMVIRTAAGAVGMGMQHSQSPEAWFMNVPGLKLVMPSTPYDAKGLLKTSIREDNPVVFFEHKRLYGLKGPVPKEEYLIPLGKADIKRKGKDVTILATSLMVQRALHAAELLVKEDIDAEVVDPRTLRPLDSKTIIDSVKKTGRLVIVHESHKFGGFGAEVAAQIAEDAITYLDAPIIRVAAPETPVPFSEPLEENHVPSEKKILNAVLAVMK